MNSAESGVEVCLRTRAMAGDDLDDVLRNEVRAYEYPWTRGMFEDCLASRPPYECRVALTGTTVVGHGVLSIGAGEGHLLNICISRDQQGRGLGRLFLSHLLARVHELGAEVLFLEVRRTNPVAIGLYESFGFREIGIRRDYYPSAFGREDAHVYALDLNQPV